MSHLALVVEDEAALRMIYETVLRELDFDVIQAADGEEAIDALMHVTPSVVLLDVLLPKVDGNQVLNYIQTAPHLRDTVTVIVTAHSRFQTIMALAAKDMFLLKPVRPRDIQSAVERVLAHI
ncbi:MAG TPA: response regulator [Spirillospora sp.]|jgi:CheY-like chemotaxis protein|nr:response regulator [Spirillospora sp.]